MSNKKKMTSCALPLARIKMIMKSSPDVTSINPEALFMIAKSTELFIEDISNQILQRSDNKINVGYSTLAEMVNEEETLAFLQDIIPKKIKYSEYLAKRSKGKSKVADEEEEEADED